MEDPPIVCVPGFLALGDIWDIETLRDRFPSQRFITLCPGPVSSHHDRAVEIFYALKGGVADYGATHACECGHSRYGRAYDAEYPEWDAAHPVHLLGHSIGGQTIRVLQRLLDEQAFEGHATSSEWVRSLTALSSPLNGDWAPYALGARCTELCSGAPTVIRYGSTGWALTMVLHLLGFFDASPVDFQLGHWELSLWQHGAAALGRLGRALCWWPRTSVGQSADNAAFEVCYHNTVELNRTLRTHPQTYYFSFVGRRVTAARSLSAGGVLQALCTALRALCLSAFACIVRWGCASAEHERLRSALGLDELASRRGWSAHDGLLATATQAHPLREPHVPLPSLPDRGASPGCQQPGPAGGGPPTGGKHHGAPSTLPRLQRSPGAQRRSGTAHGASADAPVHVAALVPGVWHVGELVDVDHFSIVGGPLLANRRAKLAFWDSYLQIVDALRDAAPAPPAHAPAIETCASLDEVAPTPTTVDALSVPSLDTTSPARPAWAGILSKRRSGIDCGCADARELDLNCVCADEGSAT